MKAAATTTTGGGVATQAPPVPTPTAKNFTELINQHNANKKILLNQSEEHRKAAMDSSEELSTSLVDSLNMNVANVFNNQKQLEVETKRLTRNTNNFINNSKSYMEMIDNFNNALKQIGDVQNWSQLIEDDMQEVAAILESVNSNSNVIDANSSGVESVTSNTNTIASEE